MRLSPEEETFLRHWIYEETHYQDGPGRTKRLQIQHLVTPADLATLIAAAIPDPLEQEAIGFGPPPAQPSTWPWSQNTFQSRMAEARAILAERHGGQPGRVEAAGSR